MLHAMFLQGQFVERGTNGFPCWRRPKLDGRKERGQKAAHTAPLLLEFLVVQILWWAGNLFNLGHGGG